MLGRARLVDHVDRLVGQLAVVDVAGRQVNRRADRVRRVADVVMLLEIGLEALEDLERVLDRRLVHVDLLEPAAERAVLLEMLAVFLVSGRAHAAQTAGLERGLEQVGGVHRPAAGRAGTDHRVDLVDEQDRVRMRLEFLHHRLEPLLEIAAIAGSGQKRAHVEREDRGVGQNVRRVAVDDLARQAFRDRGLAHARIAHQKRVVLAPAAQDLDAALDLVLAADQRIDPALAGLLVEVDAVFLQRGLLGILAALAGLGLGFRRRFDAFDRPGLAVGRILGDAVADVIDRVVARHVLLLQEIGGVAFTLGEDRDEHVGARHLGPARALDVDRGALDHPLEAGGGRGLGTLDVRDQRVEFLVEECDDGLAQLLDVDPAGLHHPHRVGLVRQRQQQMLERRQLVLPLVGVSESVVDCGFECARK